MSKARALFLFLSSFSFFPSFIPSGYPVIHLHDHHSSSVGAVPGMCNFRQRQCQSLLCFFYLILLLVSFYLFNLLMLIFLSLVGSFVLVLYSNTKSIQKLKLKLKLHSDIPSQNKLICLSEVKGDSVAREYLMGRVQLLKEMIKRGGRRQRMKMKDVNR